MESHDEKGNAFLNLTDMHFGSDEGPDPKGTASQRWIWKRMNAYYDKAYDLATEGYVINLGFGGEFVDLPGFRGRRIAEESLKRFVTLADETGGTKRALMGTGFHVKENGEEDVDVAYHLGIVEVGRADEFVLDGKRFWYLHHGPKPGKNPLTEDNALKAAGRDIFWDCLRSGEKMPDYLVYGHWHTFVTAAHEYQDRKSKTVKQIRVVACPSWQGKNGYAHKAVPLWRPTIGGVIILPKENKIIFEAQTMPRRLTLGKVEWK